MRAKECFNFRTAPNSLYRRFSADGANQRWATDTTDILTGEGWLFLKAVMILYSTGIVGWSLSDRITRRTTDHAGRLD